MKHKRTYKRIKTMPTGLNPYLIHHNINRLRHGRGIKLQAPEDNGKHLH